MGLDIYAYRKIRKVNAIVDEDGYVVDPVTRERVEYAFVAYVDTKCACRAEEVEDSAVYSAEDCFSFGAGRYSWHNSWKRQLMLIAFDSSAFSELINFSDCEGTIGAAVSAKLAKDFSDYQDRANAFWDNASECREVYADWRKAFEMAAEDGAVVFL